MPASTGNWPTAKGLFQNLSKITQDIQVTRRRKTDTKTQIPSDAYRHSQQGCTVYLIPVSPRTKCHDFGPSKMAGPTQRGWRAPWMEKKPWTTSKCPLGREKNIHSNGLNLCVSIFLRIEFVSFIHVRKRRKRRCPKTKPRFSLRLKGLDRLKNSLLFSMKFVTNPEFKQTIDEHNIWNSPSKNSPSSKRGFPSSHMSVVSTIPMPIPHREESI